MMYEGMVTADGLGALAALPKLRYLQMYATEVAADAFAVLSKLTQLSSLRLRVWRECDGTDLFDFLHPYFPAAVSEIPDHKSSPNARVNQPISNGLSWLMGVTGTQSSAVSGVPRTSP